MEKDNKKTKKIAKESIKINKEKVQSAIIIVLSLIIVFGLAYVVPELKNCGQCEEKTITEISMEDYRKLLADDEVSLIYLASPTCGYCAQQQPVMQELVTKYDFDVNYLNTSTMDEDDVEEVYALYGATQESVYGSEGLRTPTMLIVQNGKLLDMNLGYMELEELIELLQKYTEIEE